MILMNFTSPLLAEIRLFISAKMLVRRFPVQAVFLNVRPLNIPVSDPGKRLHSIGISETPMVH